ncbi:short-chain dehydrogenase/reductase SDR [Natrialba chahannaoensis JCM 10990]|uniref:Short-chain dehydrogenase/reductase SDR n=1 Tax=Natrialba chahannaoensis JCM 10990 TaxID=1227492 RepID=M0AR03_9EURY|nr:beta-ketoacyl-ACP reductase [Natrialba chahannaoensis]ELY99813.1 short-chain dehydrogenase/reductase SDR [Natrialba chahannaoensis JCM 10990]
MTVELAEQPANLELPPRQPLAGRTCLVTGASRGIGCGVARELGRYGATVVVNYRSSKEAANEVADTITTADTEGTAHPVQADVTDRDEIETMREVVHNAFGPIDVLVNNAGITCDRTFANMTADDWHRVIDVSLHGTFNCTQAFYDDLKTADDGRIINISSVIGKQGNIGQANYAAAKSGLFGFTRSLALELAGSGTTANCIAPGFTRTEMVEAIPEEVQDQLCDEIPLERFADVDEIAGIVRYLASEQSNYITGEVIDVNGGLDL